MSETLGVLADRGHPVEVSFGVIRTNEDVTLVFQVRNGGGGSPFLLDHHWCKA